MILAQPYPEGFNRGHRLAAIALHRFGHGAGPGEIDVIADDPVGWLEEQIDAPPPNPAALAGLPGSNAIIQQYLQAEQEGGAARIAFQNRLIQTDLTEAAAHAKAAIEDPAPFRDRLARFWGSIFGLSMGLPALQPLKHVLEREVIRPQMERQLSTILTVLTKHPGVLLATENAFSAAGPGQGADLLRTNLAQSVLTNWTFGPDFPDAEDSTLALARLLAGWSIDPGGEFLFRDDWHPRGAKRLLGTRFPDAGVLSGEAALDLLARHPRTANGIALKMAEHFLGDNPPNSVVSRIATVLRNTGDLKDAARALIRSDAAWGLRGLAVRPPDSLAIAALKILGHQNGSNHALGQTVIAAAASMGQPLAGPAAIRDLPRRAEFWLSPSSLKDRFTWALGFSRNFTPSEPISDLALNCFGPILSRSTHRRLRVTQDQGEAMALLLCAPEVQFR